MLFVTSGDVLSRVVLVANLPTQRELCYVSNLNNFQHTFCSISVSVLFEFKSCLIFVT